MTRTRLIIFYEGGCKDLTGIGVLATVIILQFVESLFLTICCTCLKFTLRFAFFGLTTSQSVTLFGGHLVPPWIRLACHCIRPLMERRKTTRQTCQGRSPRMPLPVEVGGTMSQTISSIYQHWSKVHPTLLGYYRASGNG